MFHPEGPSLSELAKQWLSSIERGYDLLASKFDYTPFRTSDSVLAVVAEQLRPFGHRPNEAALPLNNFTFGGKLREYLAVQVAQTKYDAADLAGLPGRNRDDRPAHGIHQPRL